jgi:hypothetical protein
MRETEASGWIVRSSSRAPMQALRPGATAFKIAFGVALGVGLVMTAGAARAGDDDVVDQRPFTERFVDSFKSAIRGTNMDNRGIDYRERSPLVVPPNLDLPPPASASSAPQVTNWPKDPDEKQRKAIIAAKKKNALPPVTVTASPAAPPSQANTAGALPPVVVTANSPAGAAPAAANAAPATPAAPPREGMAKYDPVQDEGGDLLRSGSGLVTSTFGISDDSFGLGNLFGTNKKAAPTLAPGTEPTREALTQPPAGYQTPSPNFPYAVAPKGFLSGEANPDRNPAAQQSSASSVVH